MQLWVRISLTWNVGVIHCKICWHDLKTRAGLPYEEDTFLRSHSIMSSKWISYLHSTKCSTIILLKVINSSKSVLFNIQYRISKALQAAWQTWQEGSWLKSPLFYLLKHMHLTLLSSFIMQQPYKHTHKRTLANPRFALSQLWQTTTCYGLFWREFWPGSMRHLQLKASQASIGQNRSRGFCLQQKAKLLRHFGGVFLVENPQKDMFLWWVLHLNYYK